MTSVRVRPRSFGTPAPGAPQSRVVGLIAAAAMLTILFFTPLFLSPADLRTYYLALLLTTVTMLPLAVRMASGTLDVFEPIIPISLLIGLAFGFRAMYLAYAPATLLSLEVGILHFADFTGDALQLALAAYLALLLGYYVLAALIPVTPCWTWASRRRWAPRLSAGRFLPVLAVGVLGTALARITAPGEVTAVTSTAGILANFVQVAGCVLALHMAGGDGRRWLRLALWGVILPLVIWQSMTLAAKGPVILFVYVLLAAYHYAKRPIRTLTLLGTVAALILIVFPVVAAYRIASNYSVDRTISLSSMQRTAGELASTSVSAVGTLAEMPPAEYAQFAAESAVGRFSGIDALSLLLKYDVAAELVDPVHYLYIPLYAFVPRIIWPDKPVLQPGTMFGRLLLDPTSSGAEWNSSFGFFHIGDLYMTFGFVGMLIGMAVLGCIYRVLYRLFDPQRCRDLGLTFIYILLLWAVVGGFESDIPGVYSNVLKLLALWTAVKLWLNAPAREARTARSASAGAPPWTYQPQTGPPRAARVSLNR